MYYNRRIHNYFKTLALRQPSLPALITDHGCITYAELDAAAERAARELCNRGVEAGEAIGVLTVRSAGLPAAFLAILKAGGVYVPMVADQPAARLANIAQQAGIRRLLVLDGIEPPSSLLDAITGNGSNSKSDAIIRPETLFTDAEEIVPLPEQDSPANNLAAILFTSGSTGVPKGVMIKHDSCVNMALGHITAHKILSKDRILLSTSPGFILGFRELCLPLMSGAAYVPVTRSTIDNPEELLAIMSRHLVSIAMFTPSYLHLLKKNVPEGLRCIITAGERPNADDARYYARFTDYWNIHGATEVCGAVCMHHVDPAEEGQIPSGRPFANTAVYLLDECGNEVPNGEVGELHVVGIGVSPGYLQQPQLNEEFFVETRFGRAFRSHDLARWNRNGELEALGRADNVVKISGQSVSLGEIELALQRHPGVILASVFIVKGRLAACIECFDHHHNKGVNWREFLQLTLPSYMIPAQVALLPKIPINSAGKIDQKALLAIADSIFSEEFELKGGTPPQSEIEVLVAKIWEELLDIRPIMRESNFFAAGGTSLLAIAVSQRLRLSGHNIPVQMILTSLTVETLAAQIVLLEETCSGRNNNTPVENIATTDQKDFWIAPEIGMSPAASHIVRILKVKGRIPLPVVWQSAWSRLIDRHTALRTAFYSDEKSVLRWHTVESRELSLQNSFSLDHSSSIEEARKIVTVQANSPFLLTLPPLARAGLINIEPGHETLFWFVLHHAVVDGTSARVIQEELLDLLANRPLPTAPDGIAMASYAEQHYLASERFELDRKFWKERLETLVNRGKRAFDEYVKQPHRQRPPVPTGKGAKPLAEQLDGVTVERLGRLAKAKGVSIHALLLTLLAIEIRRRSEVGDLMVGSGISIRPAGGETAIGHFVNLLPVILMQEGQSTLTTLLQRTQSALTESVEHGAYPSALLYREFRQSYPELRPHSRASLFDIALTAIPPRTCIDHQAGLTLEPSALPGELQHPAAGLDLSFSHEPSAENGGGINLLLTWNPDVCSSESAEAWLSGFAGWARWLAEEPERIEQPIPELLPAEKALLAQWERGPELTRPQKRAHELFEACALRHPHRLAIVSREKNETFKEIDARANGIAHRLKNQGVTDGTTVAVLTSGPTDLLVAVLAIWKAGAAYLPLPNEQPPARLTMMARDAEVSFLLVLDRLDVPQLLRDSVSTIIRPDESPPSNQPPKTEGSPNDIAYIIYTSGTTGVPKGVAVTHAAYINTILGVAERVGLLPDDRMSLVSSTGFDASLWELGHGLLNGITLVPVSPGLREDPWMLKRYYREFGVTVAFHAPSYLRVSEQVPFEGLRMLFTGGEAPNHHDLKHHAGQSEFWNFYGPTEATIVVSGKRIMSDHNPDIPMTTGAPLANVRISVRHTDGFRVPPGVQGELWLGGIGIASGYLNRPDLSSGHFVLTPDGLFYRSGDYGRWNAEGEIEINGRSDHQIKLNGQRVELGEIEQTLCNHPELLNAVVLAEELEKGVKVLKAFIQPKADASPTEASLTAFLAEYLSAHMIPARIISLPAIPLTPAGKVDRDALLKIASEQENSVLLEMPQEPLEKRIAAIWSEVLGHPVGRNDNFFALGGNSLLAVTLAHRVTESLGLQVSARALFAAPALSAFAKKISSLPATEEQKEITLATDLASEGEKEFWIAESAGMDTRTFTIPVHCLIVGEFSADLWQNVWTVLVARHEGLRTFFEEDETGQLRRRIAKEINAVLEFSVEPTTAAAQARIRQRQFTFLPMGVAPLWRAGLVEVEDENKHLFWLSLHHAIGDGQSVGTLFDELTTLLDGGLLPPAGNSGMLFAAREQSYLASTDATNDLKYWVNLLRGMPASAFEEWPLDRTRSMKTPSGTHRFELLLDSQTTEKIKALARSHASSLHALMIALLALEVRRRSGRADIVIGTTASVREAATDSKIIGYGVNMLPLHLKPEAGQCFAQLLHQTQKSLAEALQHARLPFAHICHAHWNEHPEMRNPQRYPLFDIAITENPGKRQNGASRHFTRATPATKSLRYERTDSSPGQDMVLIHENLEGEGVLLQWHVNAAIYSEESARIWLESLSGWAGWLAEDPGRATQPLPKLLPKEEKLIAGLEQGELIERPPLRFHELFEMIVDRPGQAGCPAVITPECTLSYQNLEEEANVIANALLLQGVKRGNVVAVLTGRSSHLPAALLGLWKAGGTYLPIASDLPPERMAFMARDAGSSHLIALDGVKVPAQLAAILPDALRPDELPESFRGQQTKRTITIGTPNDTAYIIYTSGSTGKPKGTLIAHKSYVNMVLGAAEILGLRAVDRSLMFASPSFDVSLSDIGVPLACGAAICPVPMNIIESPNRFLEFLREFSITVADITPTYLGLFEGTELPPSLRILVTGGEAPLHADVRKYASKLNYFNAYGPAENTITSTMGALSAEERSFLSAGKPLPNTSLHICEDHGERIPPGIAGEIWLGGLGISQGYLNRPELTATSFIDTPLGRRYKTGDLGRWHRDGSIEIIGRIDNQIKVNGIRIEPGEIEYALSSHPAISQAVVLLIDQPGGSKSLWAFVRPANGEQIPDTADWQKQLREQLPSHMIPSGIIPVSSIPLTVSGKVDRSALLALLENRPVQSGITPPKNELERTIAEIWCGVLGKTSLHQEDNFFALGGHSLLAIAVAHQLEKILGCEIPARELFAEPTLAGFAERVRVARPPEPVFDLSSDLATVGQREFWTAEQAGIDTSGFNIALKLVVQDHSATAEQWQTLWNEVIARHDSLRTSFHEDESGILKRVISSQVDKNLELDSFSSSDEAYRHINHRQAEPFPMSIPGLWRAGLTKITDGQPIFWFVMHHAVGDGLSLGILVDELSALIRGKKLNLPAIEFDHSAASEAAYLESKKAHDDANYWQEMIGRVITAAPEALDEWPLDKPRANARSASSCAGSHCFRTRLDPATAHALRTIAQRNNATLHALMLTILGVEVRRRTGRPGFLLGTAASTRQSVAEAQTIGYFINMLPLACLADPSESIDTLIQAMQQNLAEALQHSRYPFACIYGDFRKGVSRRAHPGRYPLFDIAATENPAISVAPESDFAFAALALPEPGEMHYELRHNAPPQDLVLVHEGVPDGGIVLTWYANASIYMEDSAHTWFDSLIGWMRFLEVNCYQKELRLPSLLPGEVQLLDKWQKGPLRSWPASSFPELFQRITKKHPDRPAIITDSGTLSYETVNRRSDTLASALLKLGVGRGESVGVFTERSASLPEAVLAIWKAGACYLPLTADLPGERLAFMARDSNLRMIIVLDGLSLPPQLNGENVIALRPEDIAYDTIERAERCKTITPDDIAYIIYTSGSTGTPKGVVLCHRGLINLALGEAEMLGIRSDDRLLHSSSPSFDLWISDLVRTWSSGAALIPVKREEMNDLSGMRSLMLRLGATVATMSPSYLHLFERKEFPGLRLIMTVGEPPVAEDALFYATKLAYFNGYGPTENTASSAVGRIHAGVQPFTTGRPMPNMTIDIVDEYDNSVPPGVTGEILLAGVGLAVGYLNQAELTAAAFVQLSGERRYRSGDLGRWLRSGELQILGRKDTQVKLRGQRVELGEIEHQLASFPGVLQAVAVMETLADQTQILHSFVTLDSKTATPTRAEWMARLSATLPSFMIPASIHRIPFIPLTTAGKVDRQALLNTLDISATSAITVLTETNGHSQQTPPQNATEKRISEVWAKLLHHPFVAREDNFFDLGGDSLRAIAVISQLCREFECTVNNLYEHPVLADFALFCRPRPDHLRSIIMTLYKEYTADPAVHAQYERERESVLRPQHDAYKKRLDSDLERDLISRHSYHHILLTGATGYLGSYLLRELLADPTMSITVLVRGTDNQTARRRLEQILNGYFGSEYGIFAHNNSRLRVVAGDLRHPELLLSHYDYSQLSGNVDAVYHCAANVNHIGLYRDFLADNVDATQHLLKLAASRKPAPLDFHFVSTLSVAGRALPDEFRLFTEYDFAPATADENYYIRTKQEAERLVIASRGELANACIHRVGNIAFAADSTRLQLNISENAFFRQLVAFLQLGVIPVELEASLGHVDLVARSLKALAAVKSYVNEIHHIESQRHDRLADIIRSVSGMEESIRASDFGIFLERLHDAIDEPEMESALAETVENYGLQSDRFLPGRLHEVVVTSERTQLMLEKLGIIWPVLPQAGVNALLSAAVKALGR